MEKRKPKNSSKKVNQLSLAEELAIEEKKRKSAVNLEAGVSGAKETGEVDPKSTVDEAGEVVKNSSNRSISDDLLETLDIVVRLLQSVADQLSLATGRPGPGSNVNSLNELSWETAAFEKEIRDRIQWIGDKVSSIRIPRIIRQLMDFGREYARENPVTALVLLALCLTSSAPVLMFLVFAVATILVTFLGFLFVEGTLLTVATVILGGVILIVGFMTLTAVLVGMLGYFTTNQAYLVLTGRSRIFRLLRKLPFIGRFFPEPFVEAEIVVQQDVSASEGSLTPNGKLANGFGPHHRQTCSDVDKNQFYLVEDEYEEDDIIIDSEEELLEDIEAEPTKNTSSPESVTIVEAPDANENHKVLEDQDLGNMEIVTSEEEEQSNEEEGRIKIVDCAKAMNGGEIEAELKKTPIAPCIQLNGHHQEESTDDVEVELEKAPTKNQTVNVESLA